MKTKFAKSLAEDISDDLDSMKDYIDFEWNPYSYDSCMQEDSTEQTICWSLMTNKILVVQLLSYLIQDIESLKKDNIKKYKEAWWSEDLIQWVTLWFISVINLLKSEQEELLKLTNY